MNNSIKHEDVDFNNLSVRAKKAILSILKSQLKQGGLLSIHYGHQILLQGVGAATVIEIKDLIENYNKIFHKDYRWLSRDP